MNTTPARESVVDQARLLQRLGAGVVGTLGVLLVGSCLGCGGSSAAEPTTTPPQEEAAAEPTPEPRPRGTATALAPSGATRTLPNNGGPPPGSGADTGAFVEPPRTARVHPGLGTEEPEPYFDAEIVATRLRAIGGDITACYERELASHPGLHGTMNIEFRLLQSGSVVDVTAIQNSVSPAVAACVTAVIGAQRFTPGPVGGSVLFRYPFVFEPGR